MDDELRRGFYRQMVRIRTYEEAIRADYHADKTPAWDIGAGLIPGEMHLSAGQEPVAVGLCAHLTADDGLTAPHRPHHLALAKGVDMRKMTAEIYGRETGLGHGKGGHMHLFDPSQHFSCSGIIAEGMPVAVGQAFAFHRRGTTNVAVAVAGEGAANQGAFHESLNLASLWKLPVVFGAELLTEAAHRWKTQLNENSKVWAFYEELSELNHNAIEGFGLPKEIASRAFVVFLYHRRLHSRLILRYNGTHDALEAAGVESDTVEARGDGDLSRVLTAILFGDHVSYYLAMVNGVRPSPVTSIQHLKRWLAEEK